MVDLKHISQVRHKARCIFDMAAVEAGIGRVAAQLNQVLVGTNPVVLTALNGGLIFAGQLLPKLKFPLQQDYVHTSRYGLSTQGGELSWISKPQLNLCNRTVLIVDDILDEGVTLQAIEGHCRAAGAAKVLTVVLVQKMLEADKCCFTADFVALQAPNEFLVGFGLDYQGYWRNAPGIFALNEEDAS